MEKADIKNHVLEYALNQQTPFTASEAFDNIDVIDTAKQVSDSLGRLYHERILARRKIDKVRYEYIRAEIRPVGFEMAPKQPAAETKTTEPEKIEMKNPKDIGVSADEAIIGLHRIAKLTTSCHTLKEPDTPEKTAEPTTLNVQFRQPENEKNNYEDHHLIETSRVQRTPAAGDCTLTDDQLIIKAHKWISKLCDSGGKAWILKIPADHNNDPDMIFYELVKRFSESRLSKINAESIVESIQDQKQPDWLKTAHDIVHGDREKTYGDPGKNLRLIAQYWSTHTGITITETDVCIMMMLLKIARLKNNPEHHDSWIDTAGYVALKNKLDNACKPKANS